MKTALLSPPNMYVGRRRPLLADLGFKLADRAGHAVGQFFQIS